MPLSDDKTAHAYAHVCEVIDNWDSLLNCIYDALLGSDMKYVTAVGKHLDKAKEILEP